MVAMLEPDFGEQPLAVSASLQALSASRTVDELFNGTVRLARTLSKADATAFVLPEDENCHYVAEDGPDLGFKGNRFAMTTCTAGLAFRLRQPIIIPDIYADPRVPHHLYRPTPIRTIVLMPIGAGNPRAALGAYWFESQTPTEVAIAALAAVAGATSRATLEFRLEGDL